MPVRIAGVRSAEQSVVSRNTKNRNAKCEVRMPARIAGAHIL